MSHVFSIFPHCVTVYDPDPATLTDHSVPGIGRVCTASSKYFVTPRNRYVVKFTSDELKVNKGFSVNWHSVYSPISTPEEFYREFRIIFEKLEADSEPFP